MQTKYWHYTFLFNAVTNVYIRISNKNTVKLLNPQKLYLLKKYCLDVLFFNFRKRILFKITVTDAHHRESRYTDEQDENQNIL